jgi:hypothetical protein
MRNSEERKRERKGERAREYVWLTGRPTVTMELRRQLETRKSTAVTVGVRRPFQERTYSSHRVAITEGWWIGPGIVGAVGSRDRTSEFQLCRSLWVTDSRLEPSVLTADGDKAINEKNRPN